MTILDPDFINEGITAAEKYSKWGGELYNLNKALYVYKFMYEHASKTFPIRLYDVGFLRTGYPPGYKGVYNAQSRDVLTQLGVTMFPQDGYHNVSIDKVLQKLEGYDDDFKIPFYARPLYVIAYTKKEVGDKQYSIPVSQVMQLSHCQLNIDGEGVVVRMPSSLLLENVTTWPSWIYDGEKFVQAFHNITIYTKDCAPYNEDETHLPVEKTDREYIRTYEYT